MGAHRIYDVFRWNKCQARWHVKTYTSIKNLAISAAIWNGIKRRTGMKFSWYHHCVTKWIVLIDHLLMKRNLRECNQRWWVSARFLRDCHFLAHCGVNSLLLILYSPAFSINLLMNSWWRVRQWQWQFCLTISESLISEWNWWYFR